MTTNLPTNEEIIALCQKTYTENFGSNAEYVCAAPGRVNLIGEHIDYNDGFVLPMALPMVTIVVGSQRSDDEVHLITCHDRADEPKVIKFNLSNFSPGTPKWANYVKGVLQCFIESHGPLKYGFNAVFTSNVPMGGGLSSSAALEVSMLTFLENITNRRVNSDAERALICQKAEHTFVGMPCGIMDQMISVSAKKDHVLLLDCRSLQTVQIPFNANKQDLVVLICNSGVKHELSSSEYPTRRAQCFKALELMGLNSFRDASENNLPEIAKKSEPEISETLLKRARHVITEIDRTQKAAKALSEDNFDMVGDLMSKSHISLRDDFEVSCSELDVLVAAAISCPGVLGSRMTGGGFGGCTVTLLKRAVVGEVIDVMLKHFEKKFNKSAANRIEFYTCTPSQGAHCIHSKE